MRLQSTRFGELEIAEDDILTFTQPIIGFQNYRRFVLLPGPEDSPLVWLQSTESGELAFLLLDPRSVIPDYAVSLRKDELVELAADDANALDWYTVVVVPADATKTRTNLKAPVVVNPERRLAKQTILERSNYPVRYFFAQAQQGSQGASEVSNARSDA